MSIHQKNDEVKSRNITIGDYNMWKSKKKGWLIINKSNTNDRLQCAQITNPRFNKRIGALESSYGSQFTSCNANLVFLDILQHHKK